MATRKRNLLTGIAVAVTAAIFAAPTALATDYRSPDTREAATGSGTIGLMVDFRSPDTREAANGTGVPSVDFRSPDTRQAASPKSVSVPLDLRSPDTREAANLGLQPVQIVVRPGGFDWEDAGIGAGAMLGLLLLAGGAMLVLRHGRQGRLAGA